MSRNLHADHLYALIRHNPQHFLQIDGIRRGQLAVQMLIGHHGSGGSDNAALEPRLFADALQKIGGRRLSLRACNADHPHGPGRKAVKRFGNPGHGRPSVRYPNLRNIDVHKVFNDQRHASVSHRFQGKIMRVKPRADNTEKKPVLRLVLAGGHQFPDFGIQAAPGFRHIRHFRQQFLQFHSKSILFLSAI